ncbi:MAG: formyl transferase [Spirochaetes bacterium]|nr:formyl transferase [Spirochaetota bacterium]
MLKNKMQNKYFGVFADGNVGVEILDFFISSHNDNLKAIVVVDDQSSAYLFLKEKGYPEDNIIFNKHIYDNASIEKLQSLGLDFILLAWWPFIVKRPLFSIPKVGTINFHPSYLPYNKGKHYNFWSIIEETQFGVSIHFVDDSIDGGDIIFQSKIEKTWEDTGESLYFKAQKSIVELFKYNFKALITGEYSRIKQKKDEGSFHYASELEPASQIILDHTYSARDLINLLRARTFTGHPGCYFFDNNKKYEIRINIKETK